MKGRELLARPEGRANARLVLGVLVTLATLVWSSHGSTFRLDFTTSHFDPVFGSEPVPTDPVSGTIIWEAADIRGTIQAFDSMQLVLDGHTYSVGEIGYVREDFPYVGIELIGGTLNGVDSMVKFSDDFFLNWDRNSLTPFGFSYTSSQRYGFWTSSVFDPGTFTTFSITQVPEPGSAGIFIVVAVGVGLRKQFAQSRNAPKCNSNLPL